MLYTLMSLAVTPHAFAGHWTPLVNDPVLTFSENNGNSNGASNPLLLTDGTVLVQNCTFSKACTNQYWKLTPDQFGNYTNGKWSQVASLPTDYTTSEGFTLITGAPSEAYVPFDYASAILADGRVIIEGGEFEFFQNKAIFNLSNKGAIYDPVSNIWQKVPPPPFFTNLYAPRATSAPHPIADASSVILSDGTFMIQDKMSKQAALLNLKNLDTYLATKTGINTIWTETGTHTKNDLNDEEGWTLLPNGKVLTVDTYTDFPFKLIPSYPTDPTNSEIYDPKTRQWSSAGSTINTLTDPVLFEVGPAVLRPDGKVLAMGSTSGHTALYNSITGLWTTGPDLPLDGGNKQIVTPDMPGALLPNGNVLILAESEFNPSTFWWKNHNFTYEFTFNNLEFVQQDTIPINNSSVVACNFLVLPTGQILTTCSEAGTFIYTSDDTSHNPAWEPIIQSAPTNLIAGKKNYKISGIHFNGMSQGAMLGDDSQSATNYPLVRITNNNTGHVFYCRTHDHSSMAVASNNTVSTLFDVPVKIETGPSKLEVVANGIASQAIAITVNAP